MEEPIANSSMLVLPSSTVPAALSRAATVASYGGFQPSRIFEPLVVGTPSVTTTSFSATGTPARPVLVPRRVDLGGARERGLGVDVQVGAQLAVGGLDAVEVGPGDLDGGRAVGAAPAAARRRSST